MSRFVVRFMKDVLGDNGRETEICQSAMEVDAPNEGHAAELAKRRFCATGRCMPIASRSRPPTSRPEASAGAALPTG
jgi:hypothetical protein